MAGAGANPVPERVLSATVPTKFPEAFLAITNPVSTDRCKLDIPSELDVLCRCLHMLVRFEPKESTRRY